MINLGVMLFATLDVNTFLKAQTFFNLYFTTEKIHFMFESVKFDLHLFKDKELKYRSNKLNNCDLFKRI